MTRFVSLLACGPASPLIPVFWFFHYLFWKVLLVVGVLIALWVIVQVAAGYTARRAEVRRNAGCCAKCGYDLRATPYRCPECGASYARGVGVPRGATIITTGRRPDPRKPAPIPLEDSAYAI